MEIVPENPWKEIITIDPATLVIQWTDHTLLPLDQITQQLKDLPTHHKPRQLEELVLDLVQEARPVPVVVPVDLEVLDKLKDAKKSFIFIIAFGF